MYYFSEEVLALALKNKLNLNGLIIDIEDLDFAPGFNGREWQMSENMNQNMLKGMLEIGVVEWLWRPPEEVVNHEVWTC